MSFIMADNFLKLSKSSRSLKSSYIAGTDSQMVGINSFAGADRHQNRSISYVHLLFFVAASKASTQTQILRSCFVVRIRYSANLYWHRVQGSPR